MSEHKRKIGIVGLGMVGSPHLRWFSEISGHLRWQDLFLDDIDPKRGCFDDISLAEVVFVCVPTPSNSDGSCNISIVDNALSRLRDGQVAVIKSTIPPYTTEMFQAKYQNLRILFSPEFLTEARAWEDFLHPARQVIGYTKKSKDDAMMVLDLLPRPDNYVWFKMTATEAEFVKYFSNVFGAVKVTLANIIYDMCSALSRQSGLEINYENIRQGVGADPRIGLSWLDIHHGICRGFTGYCLPKDLNAFIASGKQLTRENLGSPFEDALLSCGVEGVLGAVRRYNSTLLMAQGKTEEDVSKHDKDLEKEKL